MRSALIILTFLCSGCASYVTPGGPARLDELGGVSDAESAVETRRAVTPGRSDAHGPAQRADIRELAARRPAANFPASIAVARVQAKDYESDSSQGVDAGNFRVLTTQELVTESQLQRIAQLPSVRGIAPVSRLLLTSPLKSIDDLRLVAAKVQADMLLL